MIVTKGERSAIAAALWRHAKRRIFAADTWAARSGTVAHMFQFWRCLVNQITHNPVGPAVADHSLFSEQDYRGLSNRAVLGRIVPTRTIWLPLTSPAQAR
jgi:hypothetical protein